jgi:hypothetical protein
MAAMALPTQDQVTEKLRAVIDPELRRSIVELFRQPDAQFTSRDDPLGTVLGPLTMGQTLSLLMVVAGIFFLVRGIRKGPPPPEPGPASEKTPDLTQSRQS